MPTMNPNIDRDTFACTLCEHTFIGDPESAWTDADDYLTCLCGECDTRWRAIWEMDHEPFPVPAMSSREQAIAVFLEEFMDTCDIANVRLEGGKCHVTFRKTSDLTTDFPTCVLRAGDPMDVQVAKIREAQE